MSGIYFSILAFSIVFTTALLWFRLLRAVSLPRNRGGFVASMLLGVGLAVAGLVQGSGLAVATLSGLSILLGGMFIALVLISKQIGGSGTLQPGSPLMAFSAPDHLGNNFASSSLDGRPILLKFFRGHWWPYCVAELRRWEELRSELNKFAIQIVTVCTDTPETISKDMAKHGLDAIMLSDRDATLIDRFGIRNRGFHSGVPGGAKRLPIPTTALVDAAGIVRWVDQSENYQRRSDPTFVLTAIREVLGS